MVVVIPPFDTKLGVDTQYMVGAQATDVAFSGDGRAVMTLKTGEVIVRRSNGSALVTPYPFGGALDTASEKGLLGVVADPDVAHDHAFYFYVSNGPTEDKHRVYRALLTENDSFVVDPKPIVGAARGVGPGLEGPANHDGGGMVIHGGMLYIGVGDTGANASPPTNKTGSCLNKGNGKVLRVNLDGSVPASNPLVGMSTVTTCARTSGTWGNGQPDTRIFAWGLRNPWRIWVDPSTSLLWIGDVGEAASEEISVGRGGEHFGWPFVEGGKVWGDVDGKNCSSSSPPRACTPPQYSYDRPAGGAVTGGLIPTGCGWANVFPKPSYVFADSGSGWLRALPVNAARTGFSSQTPAELATSLPTPVSLREGPDGALYVVMYGAGVYRFAPTDKTGAGCETASTFPISVRWLALAGAFAAGLAAVGGFSFLRSKRRPA
jgi:glucose/arabinose dehydrogenase